MDNYATELPDEIQIRERLSSLVDYWSQRNKWIEKIRKHLEGRNEIPIPQSVQYKAQTTHTGVLAAAVAEKAARFMVRPNLAVIPRGFGTTEQSASTQLEKAMNAAFYWMDIQGDGDVWGRMVWDAIAFDMGVERIEAIPGVIWPLISKVDPETSKELLRSQNPMIAFEEYQKMREEYKKEHGVPFRSVYVPPESFLPSYNGSILMECFELEQKSLRDVMANPLYSTQALGRIGSMNQKDIKGRYGIKTMVTIVHYSNHYHHAYYALLPAQTHSGGSTAWPSARDGTEAGIGTPILLHSYEHGLGRCLYNVVGGRFGGWKTDRNAIEPIMNLLCERTQDLDEIASQVKTNIRATYWPTMKSKFDPELRDSTQGLPSPLKTPEGTPIAIWATEDLEPIFVPQPNPILTWYYSSVTDSIEKLAGSAAIYGQRIPGVDTGYHQNLQITQAEHLDERLEQHLAQGVIQRGYILLEHVRSMGEKVYVNYMSREGNKRARKYALIDPSKLSDLPQLDAQVRKPRPIDYPAATRAALDASMDRSGPGTPLLDDITIRERILGEDAPDLIAQRIFVQNEQKKLVESGVLTQKITERLNLKLVENAKPQISPDQVANADPALLQAIRGQNVDSTQAAQAGGVSPEALGAMAQGGQQAGVPMTGQGPSPYNGRGGGTPTGTPQPENLVGQALRRAAISRGG